ncbi:MAG: glycosyltransferase, partial [Planctomycetes bacterium]|nr:glycosyltransferase [Planctomycetota bacterium]
MKVALVCPNFPPEFTGGTELVTASLARALETRGVEVVVIAGSDAPHVGVDVERESTGGLDVRRLKRTTDEGYGLSIERPRLQRVFDELCDAESVDVVHVHHWSTLTDRLVRSARAAGRAAVATLHDVWTTCPRFFRSPPDGIECPSGASRDSCAHCCALGLAMTDDWCREHLVLRDAEMRAEVGAAQFLTVPSRTSGNRIASHLPWDPAAFEVVPHGLLEPVKGNEREPVPAGEKLRIGTFGNLVEPKGVMFLVYACRYVPGVELHLFGPFLEPPFEALVKQKAAEFGVELVCHGEYRVDEA